MLKKNPILKFLKILQSKYKVRNLKFNINLMIVRKISLIYKFSLPLAQIFFAFGAIFHLRRQS